MALDEHGLLYIVMNEATKPLVMPYIFISLLKLLYAIGTNAVSNNHIIRVKHTGLMLCLMHL